MKIKKGDTVMAIVGKDKGKTGKVLRVFPREGKAIVERVAMIKKSMRKTRQDQQGGIVQMESPLAISNLALYCKSCTRPARVGVSTLSDGTKARICKKCKEMI